VTQVPYRADHVGSLLRPDRLLAARADFDGGRIDAGQLRAAEDEAIAQALALQREVGLPIYSDGEYRRKSFLSELAAAVDGFVDSHAVLPWRGDDSQPDKRSTSKVAGAKLRKRRRLTEHEVAFLAEHAPGPFKATIPELSYFTIASWQRGVSDGAYPRRTDMIDDLAAIQRSELDGMLADGVTYLQLDSVGYTTLIDQEHRDRVAGSGADPDELIRACVAAEQVSMAGLRRDGVVIAMHMCRGNSRNRWLASGGYDRIAGEVFPHLPVDRWLLEYDTERAGGFEPLRHIPADRTVVLGLVSTKTAQLEDPDELMRRVDEAARYFPADNLAISPQCGFASIAEGNLLSWDDQRRKLELVVNTATRLWG
jgi:5-methyltetrahydropteroyltriglutamate--homocysteine methyltransferase